MEAQRDPEFRDILNHALLVTPNGMPMVFARSTIQRSFERSFHRLYAAYLIVTAGKLIHVLIVRTSRLT
jgi:UDP-N-acetyl-D-mannosaminuronic acid transferase (WecB/TagA/CpsF family)